MARHAVRYRRPDGVPALAVADVDVDPAFWRGRRVLVTGHTGFKGSWLALWLAAMGADVSGLSDGVPSTPSLFELVGDVAQDVRADVRDADAVNRVVRDARPEVGRYIDGDGTAWEAEPLEALARDGELSVYEHAGYWQPMDTQRDMRILQEMWDSGRAPWRTWP